MKTLLQSAFRAPHSLRAAAGAVALAGFLAALAPGAARAAGPSEEPKARVDAVERVIVGEAGEHATTFSWKEGEPLPMKRVMFLGRGFIGTQLTELTPELREHFGVERERGMMVARVEKDSPAEKAGIEVGDILVAIEAHDVRSMSDVLEQVRQRKEGDVVRMEVVRDGRPHSLDVTIAERERQKVELFALPPIEEFDEALIGPAMERARQIMDDPAFQDRIRVFRSREEELEKRMKDLEERLLELQKRLQERGDR